MAINKIKKFLTTNLSDEAILEKAEQIAKDLGFTDLEAITEAEAQMIATRIDRMPGNAMSVPEPESVITEPAKKGRTKTAGKLANKEQSGNITTPSVPAPKQETPINLNEAIANLASEAQEDVRSFRDPLTQRIDTWSSKQADEIYGEVRNAGRVVVAKVCERAMAEGAGQDLEKFRGFGQSLAEGIFPL